MRTNYKQRITDHFHNSLPPSVLYREPGREISKKGISPVISAQEDAFFWRTYIITINS